MRCPAPERQPTSRGGMYPGPRKREGFVLEINEALSLAKGRWGKNTHRDL